MTNQSKSPSSPPSFRYERKYRIEEQDASSVRQVLLENPAFFKTAYPDRYVNSIYLDTHDMASLLENLSGIARRTKYRIRWYGPLREAQKPVLEAKEKANMLGWKGLQPLPSFSLEGGFAFKDYLQEHLPQLAVYQPVVLIRYLRSYYEGLGGKVRATIDREQTFYPILSDGRIPQQGEKDPAVILEIKYDESLENEMDSVFQAIPFRMTKNSKFVNALFSVGRV